MYSTDQRHALHCTCLLSYRVSNEQRDTSSSRARVGIRVLDRTMKSLSSITSPGLVLQRMSVLADSHHCPLCPASLRLEPRGDTFHEVPLRFLPEIEARYSQPLDLTRRNLEPSCDFIPRHDSLGRRSGRLPLHPFACFSCR